jgi:hypothetical protein
MNRPRNAQQKHDCYLVRVLINAQAVQRPLLGIKRTFLTRSPISANDPKRTSPVSTLTNLDVLNVSHRPATTCIAWHGRGGVSQTTRVLAPGSYCADAWSFP